MRRTLGAPCGNSPFLRGSFFCAQAPHLPPPQSEMTGRAFVGGSWMVGGQSYFSATILGHSTVGWCMNRGAAEPLQRMVCLLSRPYDLRARRLNRPLARRGRSSLSSTMRKTECHARKTSFSWQERETHAGTSLRLQAARSTSTTRSYPAGTAASVAPGQRGVFVGLRPRVPRQCRRSRFFGRQCARRCNHRRDIPQYRYHTPGCLGRCLVRLRPSPRDTSALA